MNVIVSLYSLLDLLSPNVFIFCMFCRNRNLAKCRVPTRNHTNYRSLLPTESAVGTVGSPPVHPGGWATLKLSGPVQISPRSVSVYHCIISVFLLIGFATVQLGCLIEYVCQIALKRVNPVFDRKPILFHDSCINPPLRSINEISMYKKCKFLFI